MAVARKEAAAGYKAKYTAAAKGKATQRRKEIKKSVSRYYSGNRPTIPSWTQTRDGVHDIAATFYEAACSIANNKSLSAARGTLQGEELATFDARLGLAAVAAEPVAHPVCNPCHGWIDGFVKSEARLKQERANAGSTSRLDRMRQKKLVTYHNK